jgi:TP901 family phage tail tape measure protein
MAQAGTATVKFVGDYSQMNAGLASALAPAKLKGSGMKAGLAVGGAFAAAFVGSKVVDELVKAVNVTKDFDKELSNLKAITGSTGKQMDRLRKQAIDMGAATTFSASEAAKAQTELAKGGLTASQILGGALRSSLNLAAAGQMDLADAAETTVNAMQLFGLSGRDTAKIADMLATAANRTTADVEDFAMALKQGGSVAKLAGYNLNDTVVVLEALAEAGIKNSDAGTSMKAAFLQLINPTKKQAELAKQLGISWLTQSGELKNAVGISRELRKATDGMTKAQRARTLGILAGTDGIRTLNALYMAGADGLRGYGRANREQGTAAETARTKMDNLSGDLEELSGAYETLQIKIGSAVTPALREMTQAATDVIRWVNDLGRELNKEALGSGRSWIDLMGDAVTIGKEVATFAFDPVGSIRDIGKVLLGDKDEVSRLKATINARMEAVQSLRRVSRIAVNARDRAKNATISEREAEADLRRARHRFGDGSAEVLRAEVRLQRAKRRTIRLTKEAKAAERLQGVERRVVAARTRDQVVAEKSRVYVLNRQIRTLGRKWEVERRNNGNTKVAKQLEQQIIGKLKARDSTQKRLNNVLADAGRQINPKYARTLQQINGRQATFEKVLGRLPTKAGNLRSALGQLPTPIKRVGDTSRIQFGKAETSVGEFADAVQQTRKRYGSNMRAMPPVTQESMRAIMDSLQQNLEAILNTGTPQSRRRGGLIERVRQRFRGGGVPVALSSGEMFKTPDGKTGVVPGRPTAADNVLTTMPVGTKIFTFDGQRRLAEGASESEALRSQRPHFASGGIVKPKVTGGTKKSAEVANTAISKVRSHATAKLREEREAAMAANVSGNGIAGLLPQVKRALAFAAAHGWSGSVTSGFRTYAEQAALYEAYLNGTGNLAAPPGTSNHEGGEAVDVSDYGAFGAAMAQMGAGRLYSRISGEPWHYSITGYRMGGILRALQRLYTGGQVQVVKNVGRFLMQRGFDHRATAGILGNAYREGLWNPAQLEYGNSSNGGLYGFTTSPVSLADMKAFAARRGKRWDDEIVQTNFMLSHGNPPGIQLKSLLNANDTIAQSAEDFMNKWERPAAATNGLSERIAAGHDASRILRDAGIGADEDTGPTPADKRRSRRSARLKTIQDLRKKVRAAQGVKQKKSLLWQIIQQYAAYGDFDFKAGRGTPGGATPPIINEKGELLSRAGAIAAIANPNQGVGRLWDLVRWLERDVDITGVKDEDKAFVANLKRVRDAGSDRAKEKRRSKFKKLARFGENFPWGKRLNQNDRVMKVLQEQIQIAEQTASSEWSEAGTEYSDREIVKEVDLNQRLLTRQNRKYRWLQEAIPYMEAVRDRYKKQIASAKNDPSKRWLLPGYRRGLKAANDILNGGSGTGLRQSMTDLVGLTGNAGERNDTYFRLKDLGVMKASGASGTGSEFGIQDLLQIVEAAKYGVYANLPKFHSGGVVPGLPGQEVPIMAQAGETVVRGGVGDVKVEVNFANGMEWLKDFVDVRVVENERARDQGMKAGVR